MTFGGLDWTVRFKAKTIEATLSHTDVCSADSAPDLVCPSKGVIDESPSFAGSFDRIVRWPRKQSISLAHQAISDEADPLLRGPVELAQSRGAGSEPGEWTRSAAGHKCHRVGRHLESGNPKASDRSRHMQGCGD